MRLLGGSSRPFIPRADLNPALLVAPKGAKDSHRVVLRGHLIGDRQNERYNTGIKRRPTHPGEMRREDFLPDYDLTVSGLAEAIGVSRQSMSSCESEGSQSGDSAQTIPTFRQQS